jgi:signal transduction histidine kinase
MAVVPSVSVRGRVDARPSDTKLWWTALAVGLLLFLAYVAVPAEHHFVRNVVIFPLTELLAVAGIVIGVRRFHPAAPAAWLLIAVGLALWWIADLWWGIYETQGREPFPSPADFFYLLGYPALGAGLAIAVRQRRQMVDARRAAIDAALVAASGLLLTWVYLVQPVLDDAALSQWEQFTTIAYPVGDLILVAIAARFVMGASWDVRSLRVLVAGLVATLIGDVLFNLTVVGRVQESSVGDAFLLAGIICIGLAALHRTMTSLTEEHGEPGDRDGAVRLVGILAICLVPPVVLVVQSLRDEPLYLPVTIASMALISVLSVLRFTTMTNKALRAAERESHLSTYAAELLRARNREELYAVAERTAGDLVGNDTPKVVASRDGDTGADHAFATPVTVRGEQVAELVADGGALKIRRARNSLETVASELALALERERLLAAERETAAALATQNQRLRELDEMKDQFVSTVSHELRTPLTSMVGYLEILIGGEVGELTDDQRRFLEIIDRNSRRLNDLIEDILVTSRLDTGRLSLEPKDVDLGQLVSERVESIQSAADARNVEVRLVIADGLPQLLADPMRLGQVVDNLLSNAVKFTPAGGTVGVVLGPRDDKVRLEVSDTGVGIPADEVGRLFNRFFRASTASTIQGTGLGLSIAKGIAEAHGGTIDVESEVGVGTTFVLELPVRSPLDEAAAADTTAGAGT